MTPITAGMVGPDLAGALWLQAGRPVPHNLRSSRPDVLAQITHGLPAQRLAPTLGSLFSLCGAAHALCAGLAVVAAQGGPASPSPAQRQQLQWQTLRDHLRHVWLGGLATPADAAVLGSCPLWALPPGQALAGSAALAATATWLQAQLFGQPAAVWLQAWSDDPQGTLRDWARQTPACVLRGWHQALRDLPAQPDALSDTRGTKPPTTPPTTPALQVHAHPTALRGLADTLLANPAAARQPLWQQACAETGVWTRLHLPGLPQAADQPPPLATRLALRLGARLAEIARLVLPDQPAAHGVGWLDAGVLPLAPGRAIAWAETARGLLLHHVCLDGVGPQARVAGCQVVAPTDWNFHPAGAVAQALARLPANAHNITLAMLLAAYDACVPCHLSPAPAAVPEPHHA